MIAELRRLWQEAFGDTEETLDAFFTTGFSQDRCHCVLHDGHPVSALYWFDCALDGHKLAYIYAVATEEKHRGRGFATRLMTETREILREKGYAGVILVPGTPELFSYYEKLGYRAITQVEEFSCVAGKAAVYVQEIAKEEYARLRRKYLPKGGVYQEGATLSYLASYVRFYAGEDFLLAATVDKDRLTGQELLGNADAAPGILRALDVPRGQFRTPGRGREFAMLLPLQENCPTPAYFGLSME